MERDSRSLKRHSLADPAAGLSLLPVIQSWWQWSPGLGLGRPHDTFTSEVFPLKPYLSIYFPMSQSTVTGKPSRLPGLPAYTSTDLRTRISHKFLLPAFPRGGTAGLRACPIPAKGRERTFVPDGAHLSFERAMLFYRAPRLSRKAGVFQTQLRMGDSAGPVARRSRWAVTRCIPSPGSIGPV